MQEFIARYRNDLGHIKTVVVLWRDLEQCKTKLKLRSYQPAWRHYELLWVRPLSDFVPEEK